MLLRFASALELGHLVTQHQGVHYMFKVYGDYHSGNCYKVKLLLTQLGQSFQWIHVDILKKETRTLDFLAKNPNGKISLLEIEPGTFLAESNAILHYLSEGTGFLPTDRYEHAQVLQWLFFEQYSHEPYVATSRYIIHYLHAPDEYKKTLEQKRGPGYAALDVMEKHLTDHNYFVGEHYTIADIGLYAYTHVANEGNFDLSKYSAIRAWLDRVKSQPNHVTMTG